MAKPLSAKRKQARLAREVVKDPDATLTELSKRAGYADKTTTHRALQNPEVQNRIRHLMDKRPLLQDDALFKKLEEGLDAKVTKFFQKDGVVKDTRECVDYPTRKGYLDLAFELKGHKASSHNPEQPAAQVIIGIFAAIQDAQRAGILAGEAAPA